MIENRILNNLSKVKSKFLYMVVRGDDLRAVADKFHTTQQVLIEINHLDEEIKEGEYILIEAVEGEEYIVKPEDTLEKIARYDKELLRRLILKNKTDSVYVGQKIYI